MHERIRLRVRRELPHELFVLRLLVRDVINALIHMQGIVIQFPNLPRCQPNILLLSAHSLSLLTVLHGAPYVYHHHQSAIPFPIPPPT
jgi:hypothetical protein